jgi:hypothetical protein
VPAAGPEELSANGSTGVTCNKTSSTHIQTIKNNLKDFNSHRERPNRVSLHSQKKLLATLPAIFVTEQAFKAIFKIIGYKTTTFSWSLSLPRDAWDNFDSCLLVCLHQLKKLAHALARQSTKRVEVNSHAVFVFR